MDWVAVLAAIMLSNAPAMPAGERWPAVLEGFDQIRSQAFEDGRPGALTSVYPDGSPLLARDKELLGSYLRRGVDIERMRMRLLEADVVDVAPRRVTLHVTDRLSQVRIRLPDGTARGLPRDRPTRRTIVLALTAQGWRISAVSLRP